MITAAIAVIAVQSTSALGHFHAGPGAHSHVHPPRQVGHAEMYRPTAVPDRIVLTWKENPAFSQSVTWRTDRTVERAYAQILPADAAPLVAEAARQEVAQSVDLITAINEARFHSVTFRGLVPRTKYAYRVGDGVNWSEWFHFTTASDQPEPFTFIYFGDAQNDVRTHWSRVIREAFQEAPRAKFTLHAGDLINRANNDGEWGEWFGAGGWINGTIPVIATPGNHEYATVEGKRGISGHWQPQFEFPLNGPAGLEESVYYLDIQGVRIISLNTNERVADQVAWLREALANNPNRWTIVTFHHPVYSTAAGRDNRQVRELWQPLLDEFRVDLVLQGHDHTYGRTNLASGTNAIGPAGTVYVVSVSGPKMYEIDRKSVFHRVAEQTQLFQVIRVDGNQLRYEARTAVGELYDAFLLRKQSRGPNQIENLRVSMPERTKAPIGGG